MRTTTEVWNPKPKTLDNVTQTFRYIKEADSTTMEQKQNCVMQLLTFHIPVGIPSSLEPRPKPLTTGPPIYKGPMGSTPPIPVPSSYLKQFIFWSENV
jgi:hypothetical protein